MSHKTTKQKQLNIRNSTAEFLIFVNQNKSEGIEVRVENGTIWLTQKLMAELFEVDISTINEHIKNIYKKNELDKKSTIGNFPIVQKEGVRDVNRVITFYNLEVIISVGFRTNSNRAIQFRQWATKILKQFAIKGFVIDKKRLENGAFLDENYFDELLAEIREIRLSERNLYQKITDIYVTSLDYNKNTKTTKDFFSKVQNKLHYGIHGHTAAELIHKRTDSEKEKMGLTSWKNSPDGKIIKTDVVIAKNYLKKEELESFGLVVSAYLDLAEDRAKRKIPMTMQDWAKRLDLFLEYDERDILKDAGRITSEIAKDKAYSEFEKYRIVQDRLFQSDFDKEMKKLIEK
ncbi:MAG: cell filamentation protein Fic [Gammaproteobacteria bacterium]|nr:MAG: cell filamentation protein Fic [Gammaproteobacteria bacterium]